MESDAARSAREASPGSARRDPSGPALRSDDGPVLPFLRSVGERMVRLPRWVFAIVVVLWFAWIAQLSSGPISLKSPLPFGAFLTNLAHAPLFGLGALWVCAALARRREPFPWPRLAGAGGVFVVLLVSAYGAVDEWHQSLVPERSSCWLDFVTDTVAAACVVVTVHRVGTPGVGEGRVRRTLLGGVAVCCAAAALATRFCP